ncbi:hypothetical protein HK099_005358 [Clydaea vesicula]|uniref:FHF complex subunit HOOK-interacting protein C-terminal domain-containing protein n=1 Tax=Clydaea vesicula TaxID=447962 RepID=A0AAD5TYZ5_9FUNG|nr:hypothetical protein HK099_005358 [Clydaea vesicula]
MESWLLGFTTRLGALPKVPQKPSEKLQNIWEQIIFQTKLEINWSKNCVQTIIPSLLQQIFDILVKESAVTEGGVDGGCTEMFLNNDMLADLIRISENDVPVGFREEVIRFLTNLISVLDGKLLIQNSIHRPVLHLIRQCTIGKEHKYDDLMLELEYNVTSKIREFPNLLHIFFIKNFVPKNVSKESVSAGKASETSTTLNVSPSRLKTNKEAYNAENPVTEGYEFLLFDHLIRFLHQDGQNGDIARTAFLFLLELNDADLMQFVIKSDFSTVLIAGLGGLFSQLPVTLPISNQKGKRAQVDLMHFHEDLDAFLKLLEFVQRLVLVCPSIEVIDTILSDLNKTFLDSIVQSSIANSSDYDGTAAAYIFYLNQMLLIINEEKLSLCFCNFLLNSHDDDVKDYSAGSIETMNYQIDDIRLYLRDIILSKMNSLSEEVVLTTLTLFQTLLSFHSTHSIPLLFKGLPKTEIADKRKAAVKIDVRQHLKALDTIFSIIPAEFPSNGTQSLASYVLEVQRTNSTYSRGLRKGLSVLTTMEQNTKVKKNLLETFESNKNKVEPVRDSTNKIETKQQRLSIYSKNEENFKKQLNELIKDVTFKKFINKFSTFFAHSFEINVILTGLICQLLSAPEPLIYISMFFSESFLRINENINREEGELNGKILESEICNLLTVFAKLKLEIEEFKKEISPAEFEKNLLITRNKIFQKNLNFLGSGSTAIEDRPMQQFTSLSDLDLDKEFFKNVILLEEFSKELIAILIFHATKDYDSLAYI